MFFLLKRKRFLQSTSFHILRYILPPSLQIVFLLRYDRYISDGVIGSLLTLAFLLLTLIQGKIPLSAKHSKTSLLSYAPSSNILPNNVILFFDFAISATSFGNIFLS